MLAAGQKSWWEGQSTDKGWKEKKTTERKATGRSDEERDTAVLQACRLASSPGVGSRLCNMETHNRGLMEALWSSTSFQPSLSTWWPPTRNGIITSSRPPVSQLSSGETAQLMAPYPEDISHLIPARYEPWDVFHWRGGSTIHKLTSEWHLFGKQKAKPVTAHLRFKSHWFLLEPCLCCSWRENQHAVGVKLTK